MKLSYFLQIFLQRSYMNVCSLQSVKTLKNHERMELSWANNVYNTECSVETRLEHGFARIHVFPVKMTFCTLFSLVRLIKRF